MRFAVSVAAAVFSVVILACNIALCFVPLFVSNEFGVKAKQTIWSQELVDSSGSYVLSVKDSICSSYNNAFQLMEGAVVAGVGLGFIATVLSLVQHFRCKKQGMRRPIFILLFVIFLCAVVDLVVVILLWEKGFCLDDSTGRTTVVSLRETGWACGVGFVMVCVVFAVTPIAGILQLLV